MCIVQPCSRPGVVWLASRPAASQVVHMPELLVKKQTKGLRENIEPEHPSRVRCAGLHCFIFLTILTQVPNFQHPGNCEYFSGERIIVDKIRRDNVSPARITRTWLGKPGRKKR
ncbi:hypothetical protein ElyMa_000062600 [Elysia marginata]|uniref:Uncharacterized protein n=1 Tax=Elysia marginata TaxID=1093978 RepID=A0AAV4EFL5_9GAST|nr:hypothetical protein ElyMa_000062600 [Elysia marginata]